MATLIVEDGTCPSGANAYASIQDFDVYHEAQNNTALVDMDAEPKAAALLRATVILNAKPWKGRKVYSGGSVRVMQWPRYDVLDEDGVLIESDDIPPQVKDACCELAGIIIGGDDPLAVRERGGLVQSESVAGISTVYAAGAPGGNVYPAVDALLRPFLRGAAGRELVRA